MKCPFCGDQESKVVDQTTEATWTVPEEETPAEPEVHTEEEHREE